MILVINIGNTSINSAIIGKQQEIFSKCKINTHPAKTEDEYFVVLKSILNLEQPHSIKAIVIASVVPALTEVFMRLGQKFFSIEPKVLNAMSVGNLLQIDIDLPYTLGSDMIASSIAALNKYACDLIILDLGTATTCSVLSASGVFMGGTITAGITTFAKALYNETTLLPYISFGRPSIGKVIGKNTEDCISSGMYYSYVGGLKNMLDSIRKEYNNPLKTVATGGGLAFFGQVEFDLLKVDFIEHDLALLGLYYYYNLCER